MCNFGLFYLFILSSWFQGMLVNGFVNVAITTVERRFDLSSAESGFIASSYDVGSLLSVIPISYFGGLVGASKPRLIYITYIQVFFNYNIFQYSCITN